MDKSTLHLQLPAEVLERLDELARGELRSRSNYAASLIVRAVRRRADEQRPEVSV